MISKTISIELTEDEFNGVRYALEELGNRRQEQSIDMQQPHIRDEAEALRNLRIKFWNAWHNTTTP